MRMTQLVADEEKHNLAQYYRLLGENTEVFETNELNKESGPESALSEQSRSDPLDN
jgi:hypothetical protein